LDGVSEAAHDVDVSPNEEGWADLGHLFDLRAALLTARTTLLGARARRESRGAHRRSDFPNVDSNLRLAFEASRGDTGGPTLTGVPIPEVPNHLRPALETPPAELSGARLLE
jgi:succinate dehydrogenase / fumarate reductase flavoprotein subunit